MPRRLSLARLARSACESPAARRWLCSKISKLPDRAPTRLCPVQPQPTRPGPAPGIWRHEQVRAQCVHRAFDEVPDVRTDSVGVPAVIVALFPPFPTVVVPAFARRIAAQMHLGAVAIDVRDAT